MQLSIYVSTSLCLQSVSAVIDCGSLDDPENGQVELSNTTVGSTANFTCNQDYILSNGSSTRICQTNGEWSGDSPFCECTYKQLCCSYSIQHACIQSCMLCMEQLTTLFAVSHKIDYYHYGIAMSIIVNLHSLITFTVSTLYRFGVSAGDFQLEREDDGSSPPISLSIPFPFFGTSESTLYVSWLHTIWWIFFVGG